MKALLILCALLFASPAAANAPSHGTTSADEVLMLTVQVNGAAPIHLQIPRVCVALFVQSMYRWAFALTRLPYDTEPFAGIQEPYPARNALVCFLEYQTRVPGS